MYPRVVGEFQTVRALLKGKSLARFGDGELKILEGRGYAREVSNMKLTVEMRDVIFRPSQNCLIGIPTMDPAGPKYENWLRHYSRFCRYVARNNGKRYYSAFVTRPDSAADPIESRDYFDLISRLWIKPGVVVLSETTNKMLTCVRAMTTGVVHIECPRRAAYQVIDDLERAIVQAEPAVALLSCGPTATCLANRLAARGIQGIDLGSIGGMLLRLMPEQRRNEDIP